MDVLKRKTAGWARRLEAEVLRDRIKTGALGVLVLVAVAVGVGSFARRGAPQNAGAVEAAADAQGLQAGQAEQGAGAAWKCLPGDRRAGRKRRQEYLARMDRTITRDLFKPNPQLYPPRGGVGDTEVVLRGGPDAGVGWLRRLGRWFNRTRESQRDHLARTAAIRAQARALALQSTMLGAVPTALINGQVLRQGDWINSFLLKSIRSGACVVDRDGVSVVLRMKRPAG